MNDLFIHFLYIINDPRRESPNGGEGWMDVPVSGFAWRRSPARGGGGKVYLGDSKDIFL